MSIWLSNFWPLLEVGFPTQKDQGSCFSVAALCEVPRVRAGRCRLLLADAGAPV